MLHRPLHVREIAGGVEACAPRPDFLDATLALGKGAMAAPMLLLFGALGLAATVPVAVTGDPWCPEGWTCTSDPSPLPRGGAVVLALGSAGFLAWGLVLAYALVVRTFGAEFVRVDAAGTTHGHRWRGRERFAATYDWTAVDGFRREGEALAATKDGRAVARWLFHADDLRLEEAARRLQAALGGVPVRARAPKDVRVEESPEGVAVTVEKVRRGWLAFGLTFATACVLLGTLALRARGGNAAAGALLAATAFGVAAWFVLSMPFYAGLVPTRVVVRPGEVRVLRGPLRKAWRTPTRPSVRVDERDVWLVAPRRRFRLRVERLAADERAWLRDVLDSALDRAWAEPAKAARPPTPTRSG